MAAFEDNPFLWDINYLSPAIAKIMEKNKKLTERSAFESLFGDPNAAWAAYTMHIKAVQFERDKKLIQQADSIVAYDKLLKTDPQLAELALHKQWQNVLTTLGYETLPMVIKGVQFLSEKFRDLTTWFRQNQGAAKDLVIGFAALSGAMAFGGTVLGVSAAFRGLGLVLGIAGGGGVVAGVAGLSAGLTALALPLAAIAAIITGAIGLKKIAEEHEGKKLVVVGSGKNRTSQWVDDPKYVKPANSAVGRQAIVHGMTGQGATGVDFISPRTRALFGPTGPLLAEISIDGRKFASILTEYQVKSASLPQVSTGLYDPNISLRPVGHN